MDRWRRSGWTGRRCLPRSSRGRPGVRERKKGGQTADTIRGFIQKGIGSGTNRDNVPLLLDSRPPHLYSPARMTRGNDNPSLRDDAQSGPVGVCLLGCGVVGGGVVKILASQRDLLLRRTG